MPKFKRFIPSVSRNEAVNLQKIFVFCTLSTLCPGRWKKSADMKISRKRLQHTNFI